MNDFLFKGSGFRTGDGITYGIDIPECEYDCFVTLRKKTGDNNSLVKNLSKMWKRELKDGNTWPDGVPTKDLSETLYTYAEKIIEWNQGKKESDNA